MNMMLNSHRRFCFIGFQDGISLSQPFTKCLKRLYVHGLIHINLSLIHLHYAITAETFMHVQVSFKTDRCGISIKRYKGIQLSCYCLGRDNFEELHLGEVNLVEGLIVFMFSLGQRLII